jgi:hypothetical protein
MIVGLGGLQVWIVIRCLEVLAEGLEFPGNEEVDVGQRYWRRKDATRP